MNKKIPFAAILLFNVVAIALLNIMPVHAYTYHGATTSWDRGDKYATPWPGFADANYNTATGELMAGAGQGYAWAMMNSAHVDAVADVDHVTVVMYWTDGSCGAIYGSYEYYCKLYVNGFYQGIQYADYSTWENEYQMFNFTGLDINDGDDLDIDVMFIAGAGGMPNAWAWIEADFSYVGFVTL